MRRILLFLLVSLALWGNVNAQDHFSRGEASLGVSAAVVSSLEGSTDFSISLSVGSFLTEHWDIGIGVGYARQKEAVTDASVTLQTIQKGFVLSPYTTYYCTIAPKFYFHIRGNVSCDFLTYEVSMVGDPLAKGELEGRGLGLSVSPGITYIINKHLLIEMTMGGISWDYTYLKQTVADLYDRSTNNIFSLGWNRGMSLGLMFKF